MSARAAPFNSSPLAKHLIPSMVLVLVMGCTEDSPMELRTPNDQAQAMSVQDMGSNPFINYRDGRINLDVDPGRVIVETEAQNVESVVAGIVSAAGGQLSRIVDRRGRRDWKLLELNARGGPSVTRDVVQALRQDQRISFASHAYRRSLGGEQVLPVNRVAVRFRRNASSGQIHSLVAALGAGIEREPGPGDHRPWALTYPPGVDPLAFAASLHQHPLVEWADPDKYGEGKPAAVPTAEYYDSLYYLNNMEDSVGGIPVNINVELAWEETRGSGILVAVFDDGVEMDHPDFDQNFSPGADPWYDPLNPPIGDEFPECDSIGCAYEPYDTTGWGNNHGTSVAGVIAGSWGDGIAGVAPEASIVPVRIFAIDEYITDYELAAAFEWAVDSADVDVINFSWSWGSDETVTTAIEYAIGKGAVIVAAAGNQNEGSLNYPASLSADTSVIAVGAITKDGSLTSYSNDYPDLVTPSSQYAGECQGDIITTNLLGAHGCDKPGATNYTSKFGGTSASAAMVSGVAALVLDLEGGLTPKQVKDQILDAVDTWGSYTAAQVGEGKLNAFASLNVPPDPVTVDELWGEVLVDTAGTYVWEVDYSGGDGQYTFLWEVWWDGTQGYVWAGNNPTQQFTLDETDPSFELRVTVSSAGTQDSDSIVVTIWIDSANPPFREERPSGPLGPPG